MISYELTEEQQIVRSTMGDFARDVLKPEARNKDLNGTIDGQALSALWSTGVVQMQASGEDRSPVTNAVILEELAAGDTAAALAVASTMGFVQAIADQGTEAQREALLADYAGDEPKIAAIAAMEPAFGSDITRLATRAEKAGDGYRLNGAKAMVPLAAKCSHFLVIAEGDGASDAFIVPADAAGVTVEAPKGTLGLRALELAEVKFDNVTVPASMRLGEGNGADVQKIVDSARTGLSAIMIGLCRGVLEHIVPYTKERVVHGTPLAQKQKVAFDIADMQIDIDAMRWMTWKAAWELETGKTATKSSQLAYTYAAQQTMVTADNGLQSMGGHGFVQEHPMEMWYRNARSVSVLEGVAGV